MTAPVLVSLSMAQCPHGGVAVLLPASGRVACSGQAMATQGDAGLVEGCPAQNPCTRLAFPTGASRVSARGAPVLTGATPVMCLAADGTPQGEVRLLAPQARVFAA
jgi:uncharacterized Zn-binding protein involved in type VI secretion